MAYTKFSKKRIEENKTKRYDILTNTCKLDKNIAKEAVQIMTEIDEINREMDLEYQRNKRKDLVK